MLQRASLSVCLADVYPCILARVRALARRIRHKTQDPQSGHTRARNAQVAHFHFLCARAPPRIDRQAGEPAGGRRHAIVPPCCSHHHAAGLATVLIDMRTVRTGGQARTAAC